MDASKWFSFSRQHARLSQWAAISGVAFLLMLSGCSSVKVGLGMRTRINKVPLASMAVTLPKGPGIAPGQKLAMVATFMGTDGKTLVTEGEGHGKVLWADLTVVGTLVTADKKGNITLPADPRISDGKTPHITITVPSHPDLHADLDIPLRYDYGFVADFSGRPGTNGSPGMDGMSGISGMMGSIDPDNPSPGGDGTDGGDGSNGGDGGDGGDAPPVQVRVTLRAGNHPLLQIGVYAAGAQKFFLVDPQGGSLMVRADGGPGGSGGKGGSGGRGGSGGSGSPDGNSGRDGSDGMDGSDGVSGNAGSITVTYDPQAKPFLTAIKTENLGGPKPVFVQDTVTALW